MYANERQFVRTANRNLTVLDQAWAGASAESFAQVELSTREALDQIKMSAKTVQARGVYRAAVLCEDVLIRTSTDCTSKLSSAMTSLKHLVDQYRDGLVEIDPGFTAIDHEESAQTKTPDNIEMTIETTELSDARDQASRLLKPLLKFVKNPKLQGSLNSLIAYKAIDAVRDEGELTVSFDALMHPLNNLVLSEARHSGKKVSISYATDFEKIEKKQGEDLTNLLEVICLNIVANGVVTSSENVSVQISITGQRQSEQTSFIITWRGQPLSQAAIERPHYRTAIMDLEKRGGKVIYKSGALEDKGTGVETLIVRSPDIARRSQLSIQNETKNRGPMTANGGF